MDWNDLRYFLAVAEAQTWVAAARVLGVEHTTVSRRVAALENALGTRLFTRGPEGLTLTRAALDILPDARAVLMHAEAITRRVQGGDAKVEGTVRLTVPESIESYMVQELAMLRAQHPALMVELVSANRVLDLRRGEADLALRFAEVTDAELVMKRVGAAGWSLYASPAYLERKGEVSNAASVRGHDVIGFDASMANIIGALWLAQHGEGVNVVLRANSLAAAQSAGGHGFGLVPLPCFLADRDPLLVRVVPELVGLRDIVVAVHPDLTRVARVRATMDFLSELFARDAEKWEGKPR